MSHPWGDHPWRRFRGLTDWTLRHDCLPAGMCGRTDFATRTITLDSRLLQAERRCTIAHEMEHVARGPVPVDPLLAAREEESIDRAVARRLIPLARLGEALAWSVSLAEAADELWVDVPTLQARLRSLCPAELAYLATRLESH